ncbi:MAG: 3-methyl-2-oxobutanoate hydroxymethyltransferase [Microbacteriaceae bacterium]|nr:3-methyl-2-oxobutanoate hydroxymethyltransferase [Microbacteriaceae bacterium]
MADQTPRKRIRTRHFAQAKADGLKITSLTSYDALTAKIFDDAGIDLLLVGDSAANVVLGYTSTLPITADELIPMARAVAGAVTRAFVIADLPFGSYERSADQALETAVRFMKETGVAGIKVEGGVRMEQQIRRITEAGIPVCGHIGFTPQSEHGLGGHVVQGRGDAEQQLLDDALAVERAGAFAVVLEMVPTDVAARVTERLTIPTIGIGAGDGCDGQILVWQDAFGLTEGRVPKFVRKYAQLADVLREAAGQFVDDVRSGAYPTEAESYENLRPEA